jgi:putative FmdB family regulatory protein
MPTYEYACTSCGHRLDAVQSFSDPALTTCPVCQGTLRKVFGNVGIVLKGSGFYKNDSRRTGGSFGSNAPGKEPKEAATTSSSSGESSKSESGSKDSASSSSSSSDTSSGASTSGTGGSDKAAASST